MTKRTATTPSQPEYLTIILPSEQENYEKIVTHPQKFRAWIDKQYHLNPEIFPETFTKGYKLHDKKISGKTGVMTRRIKLRNEQVWTIHPGFVMPYMTGYTEEIAKALYLRKHGVPYEGLVYVFGRDENYWYRIETRFGEKNIVATTVKTVKIPKDLLADERVWNVYYSTTKSVLGQRIRRLWEWAKKHITGILLEKTLDLCDKQTQWSLWYEKKNAYTTSNELDRLMRSQNRYFDRGQHFHGTWESANLRSRAWAILHNYWDWGQKTRAENKGYRCPAERLNGKRYADNWLENLLVATSVVPKRKKPPLKTA